MLDQTVSMREVQPTNLKELKMALCEEWVNCPKRRNHELMKSMPRQIDASSFLTEWTIFVLHTSNHDDFSWVCLNYLSACHTFMLFFVNF